MSAVRQFQPLMPFSVPAFAATLFALGLALGTTIAVGMLFFIQVGVFQMFSGSFRKTLKTRENSLPVHVFLLIGSRGFLVFDVVDRIE